MPVSAATAARPASSDGCGGLGRDVSADLGLVPGVLGGRVDARRSSAANRRRCPGAARRPAGGPPASASARRRSRHLIDSDNPKSPAAIGPPLRAAQTRRAPVRRPPPSARNLQDTSVSISSPAAKSTVRSSAAMRTRCALARRAATFRCALRRRSTGRRARTRRDRSRRRVPG